MTGAVLFNTNSLQTFDYTTRVGILTDNIDYASLPQKVVNMYALAHANASTIPFINYPSKSIKITGTIVGSTPSDLDARLDSFRAILSAKDKNLDITTNGVARRFTATVNTISITISQNKKYATFSIEFICIIPFGSDTSTTTALTAAGRTLNSYTDNYTFLGSAPVQLPKVTITLTAVSATGSQQMYWGNSGTGQSIIITRNWTTGDVVVIDCDQRTVTVNGVPVDYAGAFPEFVPGGGSMIYGDTFNSRTMTENVVYYKRYL